MVGSGNTGTGHSPDPTGSATLFISYNLMFDIWFHIYSEQSVRYTLSSGWSAPSLATAASRYDNLQQQQLKFKIWHRTSVVKIKIVSFLHKLENYFKTILFCFWKKDCGTGTYILDAYGSAGFVRTPSGSIFLPSQIWSFFKKHLINAYETDWSERF